MQSDHSSCSGRLRSAYFVGSEQSSRGKNASARSSYRQRVRAISDARS